MSQRVPCGIQLALAFMLVLCTPTQAAAMRTPIPAPAKQRVIVNLVSPLIVNLSAPNATMMRTQRAQTAFIHTLATRTDIDIIIHKQYQRIPSIALTTNAAGRALLEASPLVESIEDDTVMYPTLVDSVPLIGVPSIIESSTLTERAFKGTGQAVVVMDTRIDTQHPFIRERVVWESCFSSSSDELYTMKSLCPDASNEMHGPGAAMSATCISYSSCHHGTHVAGIIAGANDAFTGVALGADLIAMQVFTEVDDADLCPFGDRCIVSFLSDHLAALEKVLALSDSYAIAAVNISMGSGKYKAACDDKHPSYSELIKALKRKGIATIVTSGNDRLTGSTNFPGCLSEAITVSATTKADTLAWYSNRSSWVDVLAPGSRITSSISEDDYAPMSGTSMAAPHVAGAWAVLKSAVPDASVETVLAALQATGVEVAGTDDVSSADMPRRIQVDTALALLMGE